jgi:GNAT superfamily N-acetyltransferase
MVALEQNPMLDDAMVNDLFARSGAEHISRPFADVLARSLGFIGAFDDGTLVGFVNVATDGGAHAFLLDPTVDPAYRRQGLGRRLVCAAIDLARAANCEWIHVDFGPQLAPFYAACGFVPTQAGVISLVASPEERGTRTPAL